MSGMRKTSDFERTEGLPEEFARRLSDPNWEAGMAARIMGERKRRMARTRTVWGGGLSAAAAILVGLVWMAGGADDQPVGGYASVGTSAGPLLRYITAGTGHSGTSSAEGLEQDDDGLGRTASTDEPAAPAGLDAQPVEQLTDETYELALDDDIDAALDQHMMLTAAAR